MKCETKPRALEGGRTEELAIFPGSAQRPWRGATVKFEWEQAVGGIVSPQPPAAAGVRDGAGRVRALQERGFQENPVNENTKQGGESV